MVICLEQDPICFIKIQIGFTFLVPVLAYRICPGKQALSRMWANAQRDGRPAEHVAPSVQRCKVWLMPTTRCHAVTLPRCETS